LKIEDRRLNICGGRYAPSSFRIDSPACDELSRAEATFIIQYSFSLFASGAGHGFGQHGMDFVKYLALIRAFGKRFLVNAGLAGAFHQISDFKIVFIFKYFFYHLSFVHHSRPSQQPLFGPN
jgi:hypothetical protein